MLITTTLGIEGHPITDYLGVVTAQGVSDALAEMEHQAAQLGADAMVGVDLTTKPSATTC